ncbi:MAG: 6-bladed beta-propeller [Bacteroidales bacterium]|jgi:hypothetical protein
MKRPKSICFVLILGFLFFSCGRDQKIPDIDPELLTPIDVKLSQIADNIRIVTLETDSDCMLSGEATFQVGDKYIIAIQSDGIYQFSIDGSFIRKLVNVGRAPEEILSMGEVCLDEPEDILMVVSQIYDIHYYRLTTGEFLGAKGRPSLQPQEVLRRCVYIGDSKILYSYTASGLVNPDMYGCGVRVQKLDGEVLWQHEFNYNSVHIYSPEFKYRTGSRIFLLSTGFPDEYILQVDDQDTVYKLNTSIFTLRPDFIKRIEKIKVDGYPVCMFVDNCTVETDEYARVNGYQLITYIYVNKATYESSRAWEGDRYYVIYDDNKKEAHRIGVFENDYFGFFHETKGDDRASHNFPTLLSPIGKLVEKYEAFSFLQFVDEALANPQLDATVRDRLLDISGKVTEISNPILLIGDIKEKIDL